MLIECCHGFIRFRWINRRPSLKHQFGNASLNFSQIQVTYKTKISPIYLYAKNENDADQWISKLKRMIDVANSLTYSEKAPFENVQVALLRLK